MMVTAQIQEPEGSLLTLSGITKRFGGTTALDQVDFELRRGEIHALLGENGAGKSTLIKIIGGIHVPEAGRIRIEGRVVSIGGVASADRLGIRIIHQELSLAPNLTIAQNIYLGREPCRLGLMNNRRMSEDARALVAMLGLDELREVDTVVERLSIAQRQMVEIARALSCKARILVLDEPTSSLSASETETLFVILNRLRAQNVGIIYISHRLEEIIRLADRITVLRDGRSIGTQPAAAVSQRELVRWMVGRDIAHHYPRPACRPGMMALEVHDLQAPGVHGVSFKVRQGEILGLAGLVGAGRSELARTLFGAEPPRAGQILVEGRPVRIRNIRDALAAGIVLVPEDRNKQGLFMSQSVGFNLALPWTREWIHGCFHDYRRQREIIERAVRLLAIKASGPVQPVADLSGGNQQKVLVGKWMERRPSVLILDEPTRGVDVGAREEMFTIVRDLVESGMAVILISSDLSEVMGMAHRIAVYRDGRILRIENADAITPEQIMEQLTGAVVHESH